MGVGTLISVEEYLNTSYDPDVEYVDGTLVERNVGDVDHSAVQVNIVFALKSKYKDVKVYSELRSRVTETRYRLPDVCVTLKKPTTKKALLEPAFLAIEILSEEDRMTRVIEKLKEYAANGTRHIWVFDPRLRQMFTFHGNALHEVLADGIATDDPRIELTREEVFQE
jgi:Uma2 family endonuclease